MGGVFGVSGRAVAAAVHVCVCGRRTALDARGALGAALLELAFPQELGQSRLAHALSPSQHHGAKVVRRYAKLPELHAIAQVGPLDASIHHGVDLGFREAVCAVGGAAVAQDLLRGKGGLERVLGV